MTTEDKPSQQSKMMAPSGSPIYAPDVHEAAEQAIISGSITKQVGVAAGEGGVAIGGNVQGEIIVSYDAAFERVIGTTAFVLNQLEMSYKQTREQAQAWFRSSLIAAGVGFALIGIGIVAALLGQTTAGLITAISSLVPNAAAALFFFQSKTANERVDAIQLRLTDARELQTAVEITNTIGDSKSRDRLKAEIVRKALRIESKTR